LSLHLLQFVFHAEPDTLQIGGHFGIKIRFAEIGCSSGLAQDCSIIERTIEPAKSLDSLCNQRLYLFGVSYVGLHEMNIQTGLPQLLFNSLSAFGSSRGDRDARSCLSEKLSRSLADSRTPTRY
jgi:hypothetical protein